MYYVCCFVVLLVLFFAYYVMIVGFAFGWRKLKACKLQTNQDAGIRLSCVIAFRNEYDNIQVLIEGLKKQEYLHFEVLLVDDHSTDDSFALAQRLTNGWPQFKILKNKGTGKKEALSTGVAASSFEYIIFTDADCLLPAGWLHSLAACLNAGSVDLLVGPVRLTEPVNKIELFQVFDFISLVSSGAGAIGIQMPIMCNGANLAVSKKLWLNAQASLVNGFASGDDIFLLQYCKAHNKRIDFVKSKDAIVQTYPQPNLSSLLRQRARWASKSSGYTDVFTLAVAWLVLLVNMAMVCVPVVCFLYIHMGLGMVGLGIFKIGVDYFIIKQGAVFFNSRITLWSYLWISVLYPVYIMVTVFWAVFGKVTWKNRSVVIPVR